MLPVLVGEGRISGGGIVRSTPISAAPAPVKAPAPVAPVAPAPVRTPAPASTAPVTALPQPVIPKPAPIPATPPVSPISGAPVQTSIFQPTQTTATILQQAQSASYQEPQPSYNIGSSALAVGAVVPASGVSWTAPQFSFNLDSTTILILLVIVAIVLVLL